MAGGSGGITAILPTYNRAAALRETLAGHLALDGVDLLVVVDDGSTDDTAELLAGFAGEQRLRVVRHPSNRGLPAARNTGLAEVSTEWAVFLEDDVMMPPDYAVCLRAAAEATGAQVVAAPWLHVDPSRYDEAVQRGRAAAVDAVDFHTGVSAFPTRDLETPFLCALALLHRSVFEQVRYDSGFACNAWREETDFFLRVTEAGFRCVLTPTTASCQVRRWAGGAGRQTWKVEYWTIRNNWRFLRRHEQALAAHGVPDIRREQLRFSRDRVAAMLRHQAVLLRNRLRPRT